MGAEVNPVDGLAGETGAVDGKTSGFTGAFEGQEGGT